MLGTYSIFQGLLLFFGTERTAFLLSDNSTIAVFLVGITLVLLGLSMFKIFQLLLQGYKLEVSRARISAKVFGWVIAVHVVVSGFQVLTGYLMIF
jgi:hypothetical protein